MKNNIVRLRKWALYSALIVLASQCQKPETPSQKSDNLTIYVLNEGVFNMNNSTITAYDPNSGVVIEDLFEQVNRRKLGDTGSDLKPYGNKLYCVVNISETIEIMELATCRSIKQLSLPGKQPRKIAFHQGKAYVCCFNGDIVKIDTATLLVEATQRAGRNPDGLCVVNNKLYVANSGGLDFPNFDHTISVFDLSGFTLTKTIDVALNPTIIKTDMSHIYIVSCGNYADIPYKFQKIDPRTDEVTEIYNWEAGNFAIAGSLAYIYYYDYTTRNSWIKTVDLNSGNIVNPKFIADQTIIQTPYGISVGNNGDVFITDARNYVETGDVYCFNSAGKLKYRFEAGINPAVIVDASNAMQTIATK